MDPYIRAELESEENARWDYIAELRAEHYDPCLEEEARGQDAYDAAVFAGYDYDAAEEFFYSPGNLPAVVWQFVEDAPAVEEDWPF